MRFLTASRRLVKPQPGATLLATTQLFATKSIDKLISDSEEADRRLTKTLGPLSLTALGIGAVIGSGIFTVVGTAIAGQKFDTSSILNAPLLDYLIKHTASLGRPGAGPALALSLMLVAIVCAFTALVLCRTGLDDSHRRQRLHLHLRDHGRVDRLDHRLGPDPRIRRQQHGSERRLLRPPGRHVRLVRLASRAALDFARVPALWTVGSQGKRAVRARASTSASTSRRSWLS